MGAIKTLAQLRRALEIGELLEQGYSPVKAVEKADRMLPKEPRFIKVRICK